MCINIKKYRKGYRNKYVVEYCCEDDRTINLFGFDEKEIFNITELGDSSFYKYDLERLLKELNIYNEEILSLNIEENVLKHMIIEAIEDYYEYEFKNQFKETQYRVYIKKRKETEITEDRIYYEEEFDETFQDNEHFKNWYVNLINYNYNTQLSTYNEAKRYQSSEAWKKIRGDIGLNNFKLTKDENELFQEVLKEGFKKLSKRYHPDSNGDNEKMKILNSLKERFKK